MFPTSASIPTGRPNTSHVYANEYVAQVVLATPQDPAVLYDAQPHSGEHDGTLMLQWWKAGEDKPDPPT